MRTFLRLITDDYIDGWIGPAHARKIGVDTTDMPLVPLSLVADIEQTRDPLGRPQYRVLRDAAGAVVGKEFAPQPLSDADREAEVRRRAGAEIPAGDVALAVAGEADALLRVQSEVTRIRGEVAGLTRATMADR